MKKTCPVRFAAKAWTVALLSSALAMAQGPYIGPVTQKPVDGEVAPPGQWYTVGGNAAHNGTTANRPLLRRPIQAWRLQLDGKLVGEPLVWDDYFVVGLVLDPKRVAVQVRRLADGSLVGQRKLTTTTVPRITMWGNEVTWRFDKTLELLRFSDKYVRFIGRMRKAKEHVGQPVRVGASVYAIVDHRLTKMRASDMRVEWSKATGTFAGTPAILGDKVYSLCMDHEGKWFVASFKRSTGSLLAQSAAIGLTRTPGESTCLIAGAGQLIARLEKPCRVAGFHPPAGMALDALQVTLPILDDVLPQPGSVPVSPALDSRMFLGTVPVPGARQLALFPTAKKNGMRLDTCELHQPLADTPPTISGGVAYFGACAVDLSDLKVLWRLFRDGDKAMPPTRAIPAGKTMLLATETELIALRQDSPVDAIAAELQESRLADMQTRLSALAERAVKASDLDLADDLLARCRQVNVEEKWIAKKDKSIARKRRYKGLKVNKRESTAVRKDLANLERTVADGLHEQVLGWNDTREPLDVRRGLRYVLGRQPDHALATKTVRAMLPKGLKPSEPLAAVDWLDYLDATAHTRVEILEARDEDLQNDALDSAVRQQKQQLLEWRARWRKDLKAVQSKRLLLFSPITQPGSLAKALAAGELVCDALEQMFAKMPVVRKHVRPMMVFIYPDRTEYLAESKKLGVTAAEWAAGYYASGLAETVPKSRMFVPSDEEGFVKVLPTLAHELAHQWLMERCPAYEPHPVAAKVGPKAFWIVEGFACLLGQFEFDMERRKTRLGSNDSERIDMIASAKPGQLIPWHRLVKMRRIDFQRIAADRRATAEIASSGRLGVGWKPALLDLFYAQSAMVARYLYEAEDGRYRDKLLDYVVAYYTGQQDKLDFEKAFGVSAKDLGPKIEAYARELLF